jgi:hypothetical protein
MVVIGFLILTRESLPSWQRKTGRNLEDSGPFCDPRQPWQTTAFSFPATSPRACKYAAARSSVDGDRVVGPLTEGFSGANRRLQPLGHLT